MSYSFSFTATTKAEAKSELAKRNDESGNHMPADLQDAAEKVIDAMGEPPANHVFNVATYGHSTHPDAAEPGAENITLSVSHVYG